MSTGEFDAFSTNYRKVHSRNLRITGNGSESFAAFKADLIARLEQRGGLKILDVGCGDGLVLEMLGQRKKDALLVGLDPSAGSIAMAKKRSVNGAMWIHTGDANTGLPDLSFDVVLLFNVLHHVRRAQRSELLKEILRVSAAGGRLYVIEHNPLNVFTQYLVRTCPFDKDAELLRASEAKKLISDCGFQIKASEHLLMFPPSWTWGRKIERLFRNFPLGAQYLIQGIKP